MNRNVLMAALFGVAVSSRLDRVLGQGTPSTKQVIKKGRKGRGRNYTILSRFMRSKHLPHQGKREKLRRRVGGFFHVPEFEAVARGL